MSGGASTPSRTLPGPLHKSRLRSFRQCRLGTSSVMGGNDGGENLGSDVGADSCAPSRTVCEPARRMSSCCAAWFVGAAVFDVIDEGTQLRHQLPVAGI